MSTNGNLKKNKQLGIPYGTAVHRLRKSIMFSFVKESNKDVCFQCGLKIVDIKDFSIEHKKPWLGSSNPIELFFDLDNIAFSHLSCNSRRGKVWNTGNKAPHGTRSRYSKPFHCRCDRCKKANTVAMREYRKKLSKKN